MLPPFLLRSFVYHISVLYLSSLHIRDPPSPEDGDGLSSVSILRRFTDHNASVINPDAGSILFRSLYESTRITDQISRSQQDEVKQFRAFTNLLLYTPAISSGAVTRESHHRTSWDQTRCTDRPHYNESTPSRSCLTWPPSSPAW